MQEGLHDRSLNRRLAVDSQRAHQRLNHRRTQEQRAQTLVPRHHLPHRRSILVNVLVAGEQVHHVHQVVKQRLTRQRHTHLLAATHREHRLHRVGRRRVQNVLVHDASLEDSRTVELQELVLVLRLLRHLTQHAESTALQHHVRVETLQDVQDQLHAVVVQQDRERVVLRDHRQARRDDVAAERQEIRILQERVDRAEHLQQTALVEERGAAHRRAAQNRHNLEHVSLDSLLLLEEIQHRHAVVHHAVVQHRHQTVGIHAQLTQRVVATYLDGLVALEAAHRRVHHVHRLQGNQTSRNRRMRQEDVQKRAARHLQRLVLAERPQHRQHRQNTAHALTQEGRPCNAVHLHAESRDEQDICPDIGQRRAGKKDERCPGVAQRRENARRNIIEKDERKTEHVNAQIEPRVRKDVFRRVDERKKRRAEPKADGHQHRARGRAQHHRRRNRRFHIAVFPCTEQLRHNDRAANVAAEGEGDEDERDLIAVADGGERFLADEFSGNKAVRQIVKLLKNNTSEQRHAVLPQHPLRFSDRQIPIHG